MIEDNFDALLTFDENLRYQQNLNKYTLTVFVLSARINNYEELTKLTAMVKEYLDEKPLPSGAVVIQLQ